jgi:protein gp37
MGENSTIEWTHHTFNPWTGCTKVSPACDHCYAEAWAKRSGLVTWGKGQLRRRTTEANWRKPLAWDRVARREGRRQRVFCASLADVFDTEVPTEWRADLFRLIEATANLDWLLLTKRPKVARDFLTPRLVSPNVWLGVTVENQKMAELRVPLLLDTPAAVRFLSCEPLLEAVDLRSLRYDSGTRLPWSMRVNNEKCSLNALRGVTTWPGCHFQSPTIKQRNYFICDEVYGSEGEARRLDWVICGFESGPRFRPGNPDDARKLRDQCVAAGVPFLFKQHGGLHPKSGGRLLDGRTWDEFPKSPVMEAAHA